MYKVIKRLIDALASAFLLILLIPVFIIVSGLIKLLMGSPVFFIQIRIGYNNIPFRIYKFRTMLDKTKMHDSDYKRITSFGRLLRLTRLDELPQLYNILKGDMSFVGPRPLIPDYLPFYNKTELRRHDVRPGLTGLSQVSGSYPIWENQFAHDILYVNNLSFKQDIVILIKTIKKVLQPTKKLITGNSGRIRFDEHRSAQNQFDLSKNESNS